jgi:hypothetical protein
VDVVSTHSFCIQCLLALNFLFVLGFWDTGLAYLTCMYGLVLPLFENQPHFLYWSMIRRTDTSSCFNRKEAPV